MDLIQDTGNVSRRKGLLSQGLRKLKLKQSLFLGRRQLPPVDVMRLTALAGPRFSGRVRVLTGLRIVEENKVLLIRDDVLMMLLHGWNRRVELGGRPC